MSGGIVVRVLSSTQGTKRIQTKKTEKVHDFLQKVRDEFDLPKVGWGVYMNRNKTNELRPSKSKSLERSNISHGEMVFLISKVPGLDVPGGSTGDEPDSGGGAAVSAFTPNSRNAVIEDEVDQILEKQDGRIKRDRNEQFCRHGDQGKCLHCVPLEPYDEQYLKNADPPIKFLSFHSYIRKLTGGVDRGKFVNLENLSCKIKPGCREHPPWPGGICTKCQPNAVTLNRQIYRHVDYIQFENHYLVDQFLNYWRNTGNQRLGIMYGRYEPHKDFPLGIKAVVSAIYEPPQVNTGNIIELQEDETEEVVNRVASQLGLVPVGWIFTDLVAEDLKKGTVKHFRGSIITHNKALGKHFLSSVLLYVKRTIRGAESPIYDSHFLSAEECIMAAEFQNRHSNPCKRSSEGHFGSKFVTVVVTGDVNKQIHFEGYQVSNQCMALVRDDCLIPTKDAPELGYVKESSNEQYVPDVFFKEKDEYNNEVTQLARPLPVEYLLVDMPAAFPVDLIYTFHAADGYKPFPAENRAGAGEAQDFHAFTEYMQQFPKDKFLEAVSDLHVLVYMENCDMLPLKDNMSSLLEAVKNKDETLAHHWSKTEEWATVEQLIAVNAPSPPPAAASHTSYVGANASPLPPIQRSTVSWTCAHCTFLNPADKNVCDMCNLPK